MPSSPSQPQPPRSLPQPPLLSAVRSLSLVQLCRPPRPLMALHRSKRKPRLQPRSVVVPPVTATSAPAATEGKEETKSEPEPEKKPEATGMTLEELQKLIKPLIEEGQGAAVKQVINKYATKLAEMEAKDHAAFVKDIQALSM